METSSSPAAPKPTQKPTPKPTQEDNRAVETAAAIETIEPSTGEIIVLARHKPAAPAKATADEQVTPLAKPEKRKNAKERSQGKLKTRSAEDETTPDTTATAQSDAGTGSGAKSAEVLAANEARKARKAAEKAKAGARAKARAETKTETKPEPKAKAGKATAKKKAGGR